MQNTKQVLDWDNKDIFKRKREFYLDEDLVDKIDSIEYGAQVNKIEEIEVNWVPVEPDESKTVKLKIPRVINAVTSDSESDALSAAMGKYLYTLYQQTWSLYRYRWSVATFNDLPESWNLQWDVYNILETGMNYAWTGTEWDALWQIDRYDIFVTRSEYNALPSSKLTDWNTYFIVDNHYDFELIPRPELRLRLPSEVTSELNQHPDEYLQYYKDNERASVVGNTGDTLLYWSAIWGIPWWWHGGEDVMKFDPSQTEQERREICTDYLVSYYSLTEQQVEDVVAWLWISAVNPD